MSKADRLKAKAKKLSARIQDDKNLIDEIGIETYIENKLDKSGYLYAVGICFTIGLVIGLLL